jgi:hypothetical protein
MKKALGLIPVKKEGDAAACGRGGECGEERSVPPGRDYDIGIVMIKMPIE